MKFISYDIRFNFFYSRTAICLHKCHQLFDIIRLGSYPQLMGNRNEHYSSKFLCTVSDILIINRLSRSFQTWNMIITILSNIKHDYQDPFKHQTRLSRSFQTSNTIITILSNIKHDYHDPFKHQTDYHDPFKHQTDYHDPIKHQIATIP
jgi:hypothetical protein